MRGVIYCPSTQKYRSFPDDVDVLIDAHPSTRLVLRPAPNEYAEFKNDWDVSIEPASEQATSYQWHHELGKRHLRSNLPQRTAQFRATHVSQGLNLDHTLPTPPMRGNPMSN